MEKILSDTSDYTNYDFTNNWNKIIELLRNDLFFNELYKPIINEYKSKRKDEKRKRTYLYENRIISPAELSFSNYCNGLQCDIFNKLMSTRDPIVPKELWNEYDKMNFDGDDIDKYYNWITTFYDKVLGFINFNWKDDCYAIHHWIPVDQCHFYNAHFGLKMAKMLMPKLKWDVVSTDNHTTVVNFKNKLFFDILIWGANNLTIHMNNTIFNEKNIYISDKKIAKAIIVELYKKI
jgi:hypothetical protein